MKRILLPVLIIIIICVAWFSIRENPKDQLAVVYRITLDSIMKQDEALSEDMKYIAIDMSNFKDLNEEDKKEILTFFKEKYKIEVFDASLKNLENRGMFEEDNVYIEGVLLKMEKMNFKWYQTVHFEGFKFKSRKGSVGVEGKIHYKKGKWKVKESRTTWVS